MVAKENLSDLFDSFIWADTALHLSTWISVLVLKVTEFPS